jgi:rRNA-processing protein EBP2
LRAKETQAQKQADKSKKKKEHFRAVEEWAETAASNRGRRLPDKDDGAAFFQQQRTNTTKSKKRQYYDQKYGFGGKRGRFKQNDPKTLNDPSGFNRNGNFGGMGSKLTKKTGSGSNRPGKRARDASRKRSR